MASSIDDNALVELLLAIRAAHLETLAATASDRFARDMARHVLAETASPAVR
jgi:hypothetical protein